MKRLSVFISLLLSFSIVLPVNALDITENQNRQVSIANKYVSYQKNGETKRTEVEISDNEEINISGVTFNDLEKTDTEGGAIYIDSSKASIVNIKNKSNFLNSSSKKSGGAIYHKDDSTYLSINNTDFTGNIAEGSTYGGGSIYTDSKAGIENSKFNGNKATNKFGGAIYADQNAEISIKTSTFTSNTASLGNGGAVYTKAVNTNIESSKFVKNEAGKDTAGAGGAIYADSAVSNIEIKSSGFEENKAYKGGAVYTKAAETKISEKSVFDNNVALNGGAVYDISKETEIKNSEFTNNNASLDGINWGNGGAVYRDFVDEGKLTIYNTRFSTNSADAGGALYRMSDTDGHISSMTISGKSEFSYNTAISSGGAVYFAADTEIKDTTFNNNKASYGGAIYAAKVDNSAVSDSNFTENTVIKNGGAIFSEIQDIVISTSVFRNNKAGLDGGAVYSLKNAEINKSKFFNNNSDKSGGAVFSEKSEITDSYFYENISKQNGGAVSVKNLTVSESSFYNNSAVNGGALYSDSKLTINADKEDVVFSGNHADNNGGAIYASDITINAKGKNVLFTGNSAGGKGADIFIANDGISPASKQLEINVSDGGEVIFKGGIAGPVKINDGNVKGPSYKIVINDAGTSVMPAPAYFVNKVPYSAAVSQQSKVVINSSVENASFEVNKGMLHLAEGSNLINSTVEMKSGTTLNTVDNKITVFNNITLNNNVNLIVDVNIADGTADNFAAAIPESSSNKINISGINAIGTESAIADVVSINLIQAIGLKNISQVDISSLKFNRQTLLTAIRYLQTDGIDDEGNIKFNPTGDRYRDFNPAVMAAPVAVNAGAYLTQLNSYEQAFRDLDMYKLTTINNSAYYKTKSDYSKKAFWVNPYGNFENIYLYDGPKVENNSYGVFFGFESEEFDLGDGWDGILGAYAAYNGSAQKYDGTDKDINITQNGGMLGVSLTGYKNNFFIGMTLNAGFSIASSETKYGEDDFNIITGGVAGKIGWNWKFADGKIIFQPSLLVSRSLMNLSDYKNAAGVNIRGDLFSAVHTEQNLKLIGNFNSGFQPYIIIGSVWNNFESNFYANNTYLPEINLRSFVKYGLGARQVFDKNSSGYIQASFADGGKNGIDLKAGYTLRFGKNNQPDTIEEFINYGRIENENRLVKVKADEVYGRPGRPVNVKEQVKSTVNKKTAENRIAKDIEEISQIVQLDDKTKIVIYKKAAENEILKNIGEDTDKNLTVGEQVKSVVNKKNSENTIVKVINADDVNVEEQVKSTVNKKTAENKVAKDIEKLSQVIQLDDKTKIVVYKKAAENEIVKNMKSDDNGKKSEVAVSSNTKTKSSVQSKKTAVKNTGKSQASRAAKKSSSGKTTKK